MCQKNALGELICIVCGKELIEKQQKYCCKGHKRKFWKKRNTKKRNAEIRARKTKRKEHRKQLLEQRLEQDKKNEHLC